MLHQFGPSALELMSHMLSSVKIKDWFRNDGLNNMSLHHLHPMSGNCQLPQTIAPSILDI